MRRAKQSEPMSNRALQRRRLLAKKATCGGVQNLLSSSWTYTKARETRTLLEMPTKVTNSQEMSRPDRIAIGKAIVDRPGKDDFWVTNNTAGWTFAAATRGVPEDCPTRVDVERLRKVGRVVRRQDASNQGTSSAENGRGRSRQAHIASGLMGTRELALLESHYRMAEAECRAENSGGWSSADPGGDRRYRRPKCGKNSSPTGSAAADFEAGDLNLSETDHSEDGDFYGELTSPMSNLPSRRTPAPRSKPSSPRPDSGAARRRTAARGSASPPNMGKDESSRSGRRGAWGDNPREVRGGRLTPQPLYMGRAGGARREGDEVDGESRGVAAKLHRGLVITDELRKELLNPMAQHRFKLLRGAH